MTKSPEELQAEIDELRLRLDEAEETLRAIGSGEVDAFVVSGPDGEQQVFTLKGAEQPYRVLVETMSEGAATLAADGTILYCNSCLAAMLQVPQERLVGKQLGSYVAPADLPRFFPLLNECTEKHVKNEMIMFTETGSAVPVYISCCAHDLAGNSGVCAVITDLTQSKRNEELAASEEALAAAHRLMQDLIDNTTSMIFVCDLEERFVLANAPLAALLKTTPEQLIGKRRHEFMPQADADTHEANDQKVIATGQAVEVEEHSELQGRSITWLSTKFPLRDAQGRIYGVAGIVTDITARKQAEEVLLRQSEAALRLSEQEFRSLAESMPQIVWATQPDGWNIYFNHQWVDYTGLTMEESCGHGWNTPFHPDDRQRAWDAWQRAIQNNEKYSLECRLRRADGVYRWWLIRGLPMRGENGEVLKWFGTCTDIEELKLAEAALHDANNLLEQRVNERTKDLTEARNALELERDLLQAVMNGAKNSHLVYLDRDFNFVCVNETYARTCGYQPEQMIGKNHFDLYPNAENESIFARVRDTGEMAAFHDNPFEFPDQPERGMTYWDWTLTPIKGLLGQVTGLVFSLFETTERKRSEENLKIALEGVQRYSGETDAILSSMLDAVLVYNVDMNVVRVNPGFYSVYGFDPIGMNVRELIVKTHCRNHDGTPVSFDQQPTPRALMGEKVLNRLFIITRLDGQERILETSSSPMRIGEQIAGSVTVWHDITDRKLAEDDLRESENRFRLLAETMLQGVVHQDANGKVVSMNPAAERILGKSREELLGNSSVDVEHDTIRENCDLFPGTEHPTMVALRTGLPVRGVVMGVFNPKMKEYRWIGIDAVPVFRLGEDHPSEVYSVFGDITDRKQAEIALQASEQRMQQALLVSRSFTFDWLPATDMVIRSASCAAILNLTGDEAVNDTGEHFFQCVHPDDRARFVEVLRELSPTANSYITEYRYVCKDGSVITLEETGKASFDAAGKMIRLFGVSTDITTRKLAEESLKHLNEELETRVKERTEDLEKTIDTLVLEMSERKKAEEQITRLNRLYAVLSETNQSIVRTKDLDTLFKEFCRIAVEDGGFLLSWVGLVDERSGEIRMVASHGATGYLDDIRISANDEPAGLGPTGISIREGSYYICNDFIESTITRPWHERARAHGIQASASIALQHQGKVIGALTIYSDQKDFFDQQQVALIQQMGADVSFALDNIAMINRRKEAELALHKETLERLRATEALREKEQMLIQQSRQAAMGEMIGNIAHQWRQPLNTLGLMVQQLLLFYDMGKIDREFMERTVNKSMELIQHMSQTIDDFRNYFKPEKEKVPFHMQEAIKTTIALVADSFKAHNIKTELVFSYDPVVIGYQNEFSQAVLNILNNAKDVLTERDISNPMITIMISRQEDCSVITISDNAGGIPEEIIDKVFDPYFSTKGPQHGTGVGLFMTKTIIEKNMGGKVFVHNNSEGAEFRIEV